MALLTGSFFFFFFFFGGKVLISGGVAASNSVPQDSGLSVYSDAKNNDDDDDCKLVNHSVSMCKPFSRFRSLDKGTWWACLKDFPRVLLIPTPHPLS